MCSQTEENGLITVKECCKSLFLYTIVLVLIGYMVYDRYSYKYNNHYEYMSTDELEEFGALRTKIQNNENTAADLYAYERLFLQNFLEMEKIKGRKTARRMIFRE